MAYHLFKKLQKVSSKENKQKNEKKNDDIDEWIKYLNENSKKEILLEDDNNISKDDKNSSYINEYVNYLNKILKHTECIKNKKDIEENDNKYNKDDINNINNENEHTNIYMDDNINKDCNYNSNNKSIYIKKFCNILNIIDIYNNFKNDENKYDICNKYNVFDIFEDIFLNCLEILNKFLSLNKDMFLKKNIKIDCNELKEYINNINILLKETNNGELFFSLFSLQTDNSSFIFLIYEIILILQKIYIYDNINFYLYLHNNIIYSNKVNSSYYYNIYSLKCLQILYHDYYKDKTQVYEEDSNIYATKLYDQYLMLLNNIRKNKIMYLEYISIFFNENPNMNDNIKNKIYISPQQQYVYKNRTKNYYFNENNNDFFSIPANKSFSSKLFISHQNKELERILRKLNNIKKWNNKILMYNNFLYDLSPQDDLNIDSVDNEKYADHKKLQDNIDKRKEIHNTKTINNNNSDYNDDYIESLDKCNYKMNNCNIYEHEKCTSNMDIKHDKENKNKCKNKCKNKSKNNNDILYYSSYSNSEHNKNDTSTNYFSSDITNSFLSIDEEYYYNEENTIKMIKEKKKKKENLKYIEQDNLFLLMIRKNKIDNIRNNIHKLVLNKNNFIDKLLSIINSNQDAYLINEILLLFLLFSQNCIEIKNIITYGRIIETVMKMIREEHTSLFEKCNHLYFLIDDINLKMYKDKRKIFNSTGHENNMRQYQNGMDIQNIQNIQNINNNSSNYYLKKDVLKNLEVQNKNKNNILNTCSNEYEERLNDNKQIDEEKEQKKKKEDIYNNIHNYNDIYNNNNNICDNNTYYNNIINTFLEEAQNENKKDKEMELYLDNISINIDIKTSLLLLKDLIIDSEFGLKYIYELNMLEDFILININLYNIILYIYKNDMYKYYHNTLYFINIFLEILYNLCNYDHKNKEQIGLKKLLPIIKNLQFCEHSFFFLFKFVYIYMYKINQNINIFYSSEKIKDYQNEKGKVNEDNYSASKYDDNKNNDDNNNSDDNKYINNNYIDDKYLHNSDHKLFLLCYNNHLSSFSGLDENEKVLNIFINQHFIHFFNILCRFLYYNEEWCIHFLFNNYNKGSKKSIDIHSEENIFIEASFKIQNYFFLEDILTYYLKNLKEVKYIDMLLIILFYCKNHVIQKNIYEFFICLCERYTILSNYLNTLFFVDQTIFFYFINYIMNSVRTSFLRIKDKMILKEKKKKNNILKKNENEDITNKARSNESNIVLNQHNNNNICDDNIGLGFFVNYMEQVEFIIKILNIINVYINDKDEKNEIIADNDNITKIDLNFEEIIYYNSMYINTLKGKDIYNYLKKLNNNLIRNILILRINNILYKYNNHTIDDEYIYGSLKYLLYFLSNKLQCKKKIKCLICVYISILIIYYLRSEKIKTMLIQHIIQNNLFNVLYNLLNYYCTYKFKKKYFFLSSFDKNNDLHINIKNVLNIKRNKYFFYYSNEKALYFIHYIYTNFIHHSFLTNVFEQRGTFFLNNKELNYKSDCLKYIQQTNKKKKKKSKSKSKKKKKKNKYPSNYNDKNCDSIYNTHFYNNNDIYNFDEQKSFYDTNFKGTSNLMCAQNKDRTNDPYSNLYSVPSKKNEKSKKNKLIKHINNDISDLRKKLDNQEIEHIQEKVYLNKIIEKKNDIINNILYTYLLLKEKNEKTEEENIKLKNKLLLKEKENDIILNQNVDTIKNDYIILLNNMEETKNENEKMNTQLDKYTDLLIYLYDNIKECRAYMQNIENITFFKNKNEKHNQEKYFNIQEKDDQPIEISIEHDHKDEINNDTHVFNQMDNICLNDKSANIVNKIYDNINNANDMNENKYNMDEIYGNNKTYNYIYSEKREQLDNLMLNQINKNEVYQTSNQIYDQSYNHTNDQSYNQLNVQSHSELNGQSYNQQYNEIYRQPYDTSNYQAYNQIYGQYYDNTNFQTYNQMYSQPYDNANYQTYNQTDDNTNNPK
ncbi:conserved Plasmodium protein, unknown function [Plasmodium gaboni]|uniref:Uncharacterized protein n=1 Tax=Plasmodium gaboni TaxID=647221 RepID=A0ABY1UKC2_9APIC|nr:conserved Plasmodium protein, unknown function [Plasmodium gaboni]